MRYFVETLTCNSDMGKAAHPSALAHNSMEVSRKIGSEMALGRRRDPLIAALRRRLEDDGGMY
jgi:hypothetical protein